LTPGTLYVVATPIGNLDDITLRALAVLKQVDLIACEDTRHSRKLLDHYDIHTPLVSYHEHNEAERAQELMAKLRGGASVALISDAGTPLISDPGYRLVQAAAAAGIAVTPIPGPSAAVAALSASGLPTDSFRFCGFLPARASQRVRLLSSLASDPATLIFYEAPHRIVETLGDVLKTLGNRRIAIARELTKMHEEFIRGTVHEAIAWLRARPAVKGELTVLIAKADEPAASAEPVRQAVARLEREGVGRMEAMKRVARERGISKRDVYRELANSGEQDSG
jgi:16S rRNA (cytidine1402-2'-O)-methyltransferase